MRKGAAGVLTVYWNDQEIGTINEPFSLEIKDMFLEFLERLPTATTHLVSVWISSRKCRRLLASQM